MGFDHSEAIRQSRADAAGMLASLFDRWKSERPSFEEAFAKEIRAYPQMEAQSYRKWAADMARFDAGAPIQTIESLLPPPAAHRITAMMHSVEARGIPSGSRLAKVLAFLETADFASVPVLRLRSALWASLAREAGQRRLPNEGVFTDFDVISSFLPYCDAMLLDGDSVGLLRKEPLHSIADEFQCKVFSARNLEEFRDYLTQIVDDADTQHLSLVADVYGSPSPAAFTTLFTHGSGATAAP